MRVYIVRHGKAVDADEGSLADFDRTLTERGHAQAEFLAARLVAGGAEFRPEVMLSSRYPRAIQTARAMQAALGCELAVERGLEVDHPIGEAIELIEREHRAGRKSVMLVGHNPQLGELIAVLASGLAPQEMILKTGEMVALDVKPSRLIGSAKIVGRLRMGTDKNDESIMGGVFAIVTGGRR
ncbi:MAG: phosphohistidine phosphatase SixA [Phycisphaerales bacterium]